MPSPITIAGGGSAAVLPDPRHVKQAIRARIRVERRLRGPIQRAAEAHGIAAVVLELPEIAAAHCVAAFISAPDAPGTALLRRALRSGGVRVLLPVLLGDGHLDWAVDSGPLPSPGLDDPEPTGPLLGLEGIGEAQVVIIPALAVDTLGNRLGQGAGFYDRTLRMIEPSVPVFAVVHEGEVLDAAIEPLPVQAHDQPVDAVITPHRCLRLPPRRRR
jgi:5-formyltetrahydrofolate cyclo-ligase